MIKKKNQLNRLYCGLGLVNYYSNVQLTEALNQPYTRQAEKYCDSVDQERYKMYKDYYLKHHTN